MIHGVRRAELLPCALAIPFGLIGVDPPHLLQEFLGIGCACVRALRATLLGFLLFPGSRGCGSLDAFRKLCVGIGHGLYLRVNFKFRSNVSTSGALSIAAL